MNRRRNPAHPPGKTSHKISSRLKFAVYNLVTLNEVMPYLQMIQRAVDYIENHLHEEFTVDSVARAAGLSRWHFQVIFSAIVGDTLKEYIRKRRLTAAAIALGKTDERIITLALDAGFESHEAFTRAFRTMFGLTPAACRKAGPKSVLIRHKPKITRAYLNHLYQDITMKPVIKELAPMHIAGFGGRFISAISPDANNFTVIPKLWGDYMKHRAVLENRLSPTDYGVVICLGEKDRKSHPDEMLYIAGTAVTDVKHLPKGMISAAIPTGKYAVFTHRGPVENIRHTVNYIYASWLPKFGRKLRDAPHLEVYDERFKLGHADSELDVCVPVE
jgi:predicted transcriptional regulator YdeE/AraC-like DNA-binding protein